MHEYNAIIIDDEINVRQALEFLLRKYCPEISICGLASSAEEGRKLLLKNNIQLIFLDIAMPVESGFEFLNTIDTSKYAIIFTTAYQDYAIKAIRASAIDYLLKPINPNELREAVVRAMDFQNIRVSKTEAAQVYKQSLDNLAHQVKKDLPVSKITIAEQFGFRVISVNQIRYLEADSNYTIVHLDGLEKVVSSRSLGEFEKILEEPDFIRIHKSTILNIHYLKSYSSYQGHFAIIDDNTRLSISRRRLTEFRDAVAQLAKNFD